MSEPPVAKNRDMALGSSVSSARGGRQSEGQGRRVSVVERRRVAARRLAWRRGEKRRATERNGADRSEKERKRERERERERERKRKRKTLRGRGVEMVNPLLNRGFGLSPNTEACIFGYT